MADDATEFDLDENVDEATLLLSAFDKNDEEGGVYPTLGNCL